MPDPEVTQLLNAIDHGDPHAAEKLLPLVYDDLRRLASVKMAGEHPGQTIQATALVHEAWLKISGNEDQRWENRKHFIAAAAEAMRRILIDRARRRQRIKHGGELKRVDMDGLEIAAPATGNDEKLLEIHEALDALAAEDPGKAEVVKLRFFCWTHSSGNGGSSWGHRAHRGTSLVVRSHVVVSTNQGTEDTRKVNVVSDNHGMRNQSESEDLPMNRLPDLTSF